METTMITIMTAMAIPMIRRIYVEIHLADDTTNKRNYVTFMSFHLHKLKIPELAMRLVDATRTQNLPHVL